MEWHFLKGATDSSLAWIKGGGVEKKGKRCYTRHLRNSSDKWKRLECEAVGGNVTENVLER